MCIKLLKETKFESSRKRGAFTIPVKIGEYPIVDSTSCTLQDNFISFYRVPYLKKLFLKGNPRLIFLKSKYELKKKKQLSNFLEYVFIKYTDIIVSNGFYYSKYFNMNYYPTYFYKPLSTDSNISKKYKYGIYIRDEYNDAEALDIFLKENEINKCEVLILGKDIFNSLEFFNSFDIYLVNNAEYDSVSNTLLEALYFNKKIKLMNKFAISNGNKELLEAFYYFKKDFFIKLDNLNDYCWKDIKNLDDLYKRKEVINKLFKKSKTFINFLNNF